MLHFGLETFNLERQYSSCIVIGFFESYGLSQAAMYLDKISNGYISSILYDEKLEGKIGQTLLLYQVPNILSKRILLIGCGKETELDIEHYRNIFGTLILVLKKISVTEVICFLTNLQLINCNIYWKIRYAIEIINNSMYSFNRFKSNQLKLDQALRKIIFNVTDMNDISIGKRAIKHGLAISTGINVAKDLSNMPPNICNASYLSSQACALSDKHNKLVQTTILNKLKMQEIGMNAYIAVGKGSANESLMTIIEYKGVANNNIKPIVLIGKGMTFDSGGISIKNANHMDEMKYDMCGAAAVYGTIHMAIELNLPLYIIAILAGAENMVDGSSFRPGDILTTLSGQTVEILNTDAEGRLVLCDTLTYVERFNPEIVIDVATLTGACVVALGHDITGMISNDTSLANALIHAANETKDYIWRLPLRDNLKEQLASNIADMTNVGGIPGGAITAGYFLSKFAKKYPWAHLDIAGTAWTSGQNKGATGRPVAMLSQFLLRKAELYDN